MKKGFTLIELLVVIAIIGILASLVISALTGARLRAQDTQTKNNVRSLSTALEQYYTDQTTQAYPVSAAQIAFNNAILTGALGTYTAGGATSQVFTGYTGVENGYITPAGGAKYLAASSLRNITEAGTANPGTGVAGTGNGVYITSATGGLTMLISGTDSSLASINTPDNGANQRAFVIYGPQ